MRMRVLVTRLQDTTVLIGYGNGQQACTLAAAACAHSRYAQQASNSAKGQHRHFSTFNVMAANRTADQFAADFCLLHLYFQTKGVRGIASIEIDTAAWIAAVAAVGAAVVGSALLWPVMRRNVKR
jgi:hypothetical protein